MSGGDTALRTHLEAGILRGPGPFAYPLRPANRPTATEETITATAPAAPF